MTAGTSQLQTQCSSQIVDLVMYRSICCLLACWLVNLFFMFFLMLYCTRGSFSLTVWFVFFPFCQDLTAINVTKTGHRKKVLSESAKLESRMVFPNEKPVSFYIRLRMDSSIISGTESTVTERVKYPYMMYFPESRVSFELSRQLGTSNETLLAGSWCAGSVKSFHPVLELNFGCFYFEKNVMKYLIYSS